ncbi:hypothetical protein [Streptomyces sp. NPDC003863]
MSNLDMGRRRLLKMFGLSATATTAAILQADPVLAATLGHDERTGVSPATYQAPKGLAQNTAAKQTALDWIGANEAAITKLSDDVWQHAELSLREWKSSLATASLLKANDFTVTWGSAGFPTAFVATYGTEGPVIGFNAEYDALPGLSQKKGAASHDPLVHHYDAYGPTSRRPPSSCSAARARNSSSARPTRPRRASTTAWTPSWAGTRSTSRCRSGTPSAP